MRNIQYIIVSLVVILCSLSQYAYGRSKVIIGQGDDYVNVFAGNNKKYIVKNNIDLGGKIISIGTGCELVFKGGSLANGTLVGNDTKLTPIDRNVFTNCTILGTWIVKYSISSMFDKDMGSIALLRNLSTLSKTVRLKSDRDYIIFANDDEIVANVIEAADDKKPIIRFHTENPNVPGINIIGDNIAIRNLIIHDDYLVSNDVKYGTNNSLIGNTVTIKSNNKTVFNLLIEGCDFCGGTSSSFVASSHVQSCIVKNCSFSGYMADHGVYCSMNTEQFVVEDCIINDVTYTVGLFKVRSSNNLKLFKLKNVSAHNFNGYLVALSLLSNPVTQVSFDNVLVTKDENNNSVFYGFYVADETDGSIENKLNARKVVFSNCRFNYGYDSNALLYPGAGRKPHVELIEYNKVDAIGSNFGGGIVDVLSVKNSCFEDFCSDKGLSLNAISFVIQNTSLSSNKKINHNCVFLLNYSAEITKSVTIKNVKVELNSPFFIKIVKGDKMNLSLKHCEFCSPYRSLVNRPRSLSIDYNLRNNIMQNKKDMDLESVF